MRDWDTWVRRQLDLPAMTDGRDQRILGELAAHLEEVWLRARARGATEEEALAQAEAKLGDRRAALEELLRAERHHAASRAARGVERAEERLRAGGGRLALVADLMGELRVTTRTLARRPLFATVVVLTLALGVGATTAIFTLLDAIILSPLPFHDSGRLVALSHRSSGAGGGDVGHCAAWHYTYLDESRVFERLAMYSSRAVSVTGHGDPESVEALVATGDLFGTLGVTAVLGRTLVPADEDPGGEPVIMLGHGYWRSRFGADSSVVDRTLVVNGVPRQIVGVAPPSVNALGDDFDLVIPLRFSRATLFVGNVGFGGIARLRDGVGPEEAAADMARMLPLAFEKFPGGPVFESARQANYVPVVQPLASALVGGVATLLWVIMAGVALVLLIACANVANLTLVRADGRHREMAMRAAMGASRARMTWEHLKESLVLCALGCVGALALAHGGLRLLAAMPRGRLPRLDEVALDPRALLFASAVSLGAALVFSVFPAVRFRGTDLVGALKQGRSGSGGGRAPHLLRHALAAGQVAMALVVLTAAGLVFRSARALHRADTGFANLSDVLAVRVQITGSMVRDENSAAQMQENIARALGEIAGVRSVGMATALPMGPGGNINPLYVDGITVAGTSPPATRRHRWVGGGYFETLGIPLLAGRTLTWRDAQDRAPVAMVSRSLALEYWGSERAAIGKRVAARPDPPRWYEVVGVVGDVREDGLGEEPAPMVYWPQVTLAFFQGDSADAVMLWGGVTYAIRSDRVGAPGFLEDVRRAVWSVNADLPLTWVGSMSMFAALTADRTSFTLKLLGIAGLVAVFLGLVGVYGVVWYAVSQRTAELGMRMVLGADGRRVRAMVLRQGLALAAVGVGAGLALSLGATRALSSLLYGVSPTDPATFAVVAAGLAAAAALASYVPAWRASRVNPMVVLRAE